jgi:hypothetical protein
MLLSSFTFRSARVSTLVIVLSDSSCERFGKWGTCPNLKEHRWCTFSWNMCDRKWQVRREKFISAYTNHGKTTSAKRNSGRQSTVTERDRSTATQVIPEPTAVIILKAPYPLSPTCASQIQHWGEALLQLLNHFLLRAVLRFVSHGVTIIKARHQTTGNMWYGQMVCR